VLRWSKKEARLTLAERIRDTRRARGLTQERVAVPAGVSLRAYRALESGEATDPRFSTLQRIASVLGVTVGELVGEADPAGKAEAPSLPEASGEERRARPREQAWMDLVEAFGPLTIKEVVARLLKGEQRRASETAEEERRSSEMPLVDARRLARRLLDNVHDPAQYRLEGTYASILGRMINAAMGRGEMKQLEYVGLLLDEALGLYKQVDEVDRLREVAKEHGTVYNGKLAEILNEFRDKEIDEDMARHIPELAQTEQPPTTPPRHPDNAG
jgi:transcriptional regulator with XRE-family HTH domain